MTRRSVAQVADCAERCRGVARTLLKEMKASASARFLDAKEWRKEMLRELHALRTLREGIVEHAALGKKESAAALAGPERSKLGHQQEKWKTRGGSLMAHISLPAQAGRRRYEDSYTHLYSVHECPKVYSLTAFLLLSAVSYCVV